MALETLKGVTKIGKFGVVIMDELREKHPDKFNESGTMDYKWFEKRTNDRIKRNVEGENKA